MKEIHFYTDYSCVPDYIRFDCGWYDTLKSIVTEDIVHTTQMALLSTTLFVDGFRIFIHERLGDVYEIKLGGDNERTDREIRPGHDLFRLWSAGEFNE